MSPPIPANKVRIHHIFFNAGTHLNLYKPPLLGIINGFLSILHKSKEIAQKSMVSTFCKHRQWLASRTIFAWNFDSSLRYHYHFLTCAYARTYKYPIKQYLGPLIFKSHLARERGVSATTEIFFHESSVSPTSSVHKWSPTKLQHLRVPHNWSRQKYYMSASQQDRLTDRSPFLPYPASQG